MMVGTAASEISSLEFEYVRGLVKALSSINLDESKGYLVSSRLLPVVREEGFDSVSALISSLRSRPQSALHTRVVEAIATTETSFFRDHHPFAALRDHVLPDLIRKRRTTTHMLTIWCAACSSGQEPYSVAMTLRELLPDPRPWTIQLLASDLSETMLDRARSGTYQQLEVNRGLPARHLVRFFEQDGAQWNLRSEIRDMVTFFQHNLGDEWTRIPQVDLLLMRNVLIYFDIETRRRILHQIRRHLKPDGFLILGAAETTLNLDVSFRRVRFDRAVLYQPCSGGGS